MVALQCVQDQALVRFRDLRICEPPFVGQVHLRRDRACVKTGRLGVEFEIDRFRGLDTEDKFVSADVFEDTLCDVLELYTNFNFRFVQS